MAKQSRNRVGIVALLAGGLLMGSYHVATAQENAPGESTVVVESAEGAMPAPAEAEAAPVPAVYHPADIHYRSDRHARRIMRCTEPVYVTMIADDPADCLECPVEVPLCIPACCTGEPVVHTRCGLLGRGVVEYCWPCGFKAEVVFRHRGDILVRYSG